MLVIFLIVKLTQSIMRLNMLVRQQISTLGILVTSGREMIIIISTAGTVVVDCKDLMDISITASA